MYKNMEYEICYLIGESRETDLDSIRKGVEEIVTKEGGKLLDGEFLEKRKMAYEIKKEVRGTYIAKRFSVDDKDTREKKEYPGKDVVAEITKKMNLNNDVLRFIMVKTDDLPELKTEEELKEEKDMIQKEKEEREEKREKKEEKKTVRKAKKEVVKKKEEKEEVVEEKKEKKEEKVEKKEEKEEVAKEEVVKEEKKEKKEVKKEKTEKKSEEKEDEDIDKKLDEILNM
jgi:ribosomal protein S6